MMAQPIVLQRPRAAAIAVIAIGLPGLAGCVLTGTEFREAAGPAVQAGVTQVVDGLLEGIFAVIEPEATSDSSD